MRKMQRLNFRQIIVSEDEMTTRVDGVLIEKTNVVENHRIILRGGV